MVSLLWSLKSSSLNKNLGDAVQAQLKNVELIQVSSTAFAALRDDA